MSGLNIHFMLERCLLKMSNVHFRWVFKVIFNLGGSGNFPEAHNLPISLPFPTDHHNFSHLLPPPLPNKYPRALLRDLRGLFLPQDNRLLVNESHFSTHLQNSFEHLGVRPTQNSLPGFMKFTCFHLSMAVIKAKRHSLKQ